jgi:protein-disulfide isomerase
LKIIRLLSISLALIFCATSFNAYADDVAIGGFDPTVSVPQSVSNELAESSGIRYARELLHDRADPVGGNLNGRLALVEFFDYRCPHCVRMNSSIIKLSRDNQDLRLVFKMLPVLGPESELAARAALAANIQGKFLPFHQALMNSDGDVSQSNIMSIASSLGLDITKLKSDMNSEYVSNALSQNIDLANQLGINGTPALFLMKSSLTEHSPHKDITFVIGEASFTELQQNLSKIN